MVDFATSGRNNCYVPMQQLTHRDAANLTSCQKILIFVVTDDRC